MIAKKILEHILKIRIANVQVIPEYQPMLDRDWDELKASLNTDIRNFVFPGKYIIPNKIGRIHYHDINLMKLLTDAYGAIFEYDGSILKKNGKVILNTQCTRLTTVREIIQTAANS